MAKAISAASITISARRFSKDWLQITRSRRSIPIDHIEQMAQAAVLAAVETEGDAREINVVVVFLFFRRRFDDLKFLAQNNVLVIGVEAFNGRRTRSVFEAQHQQVFDKPARVIIAVKTR